MKKSITPSIVEGRVEAPASKSMTQRCVAGALLAKGRSRILNPSTCDDALAAIRIARSLGAEIFESPGRLDVKGGFQPVTDELDCGESGLCLRLFSPIAGLARSTIRIDGHGSLKRRPVGMIEKPLTALGAQCTTANGYPPVSVRGPLPRRRGRGRRFDQLPVRLRAPDGPARGREAERRTGHGAQEPSLRRPDHPRPRSVRGLDRQ